MLTVKEVAGRLKLNEQTIYRWIGRQRLHPVRLGRSLRFSEDEITAIERAGMAETILQETEPPVPVTRPRRKKRVWEPA